MGNQTTGTKFFAGLCAALLAAGLGVLGTYAYNSFRGPEDAVNNDTSVREANDRADTLNPEPIEVKNTNAENTWTGWVSDQSIAMSGRSESDSFPGGGQAIRVGRPTRLTDVAGFESTGPYGPNYSSQEVAFDLKSKLNSTISIAKIVLVVDEIKESPSTTVYYAAPQGDNPRGQLAFNLTDAGIGDEVEALLVAPDGQLTSQSYFDYRLVSLTADEYVGFVNTVYVAPGKDVRYHFRVYLDDGKTAEVFANEGVRFRTVAYPQSATTAYVATRDADGDPNEFFLRTCTWIEQCAYSFHSAFYE